MPGKKIVLFKFSRVSSLDVAVAKLKYPKSMKLTEEPSTVFILTYFKMEKIGPKIETEQNAI